MDVNAMDGTYLDYVKAEEVPLGKEPNALADHTDAELPTGRSLYDRVGWSGCDGSSWDRVPPAVQRGWEEAARYEAAILRVRGVVKDLIDAGNTYWAREILTALEPGSVDDHG